MDAAAPTGDDAASTTFAALSGHLVTDVLQNLDVRSLARSLQVCRAWRAIAGAPPLWMALLARLEGCATPVLHEPALQQLGLVRYVGWRTRWWGDVGSGSGTNRRLQLLIEQPHRLLAIESTSSQDPRWVRHTLDYEHSVDPPDNATAGSSRQGLARPQYATWSVTEEMVCFTLVTGDRGDPRQRKAYVAVNEAEGSPLLRILLDDYQPPFYYCWSSCGNYVAMLGNWFNSGVALRVLDVASALCGAELAPRLAFVRTARPLFLCWCPTAPKLCVLGNDTEYETWDATSGALVACVRVPATDADPCPAYKSAPFDINECQTHPLLRSCQHSGATPPLWFARSGRGSSLLLVREAAQKGSAAAAARGSSGEHCQVPLLSLAAVDGEQLPDPGPARHWELIACNGESLDISAASTVLHMSGKPPGSDMHFAVNADASLLAVADVHRLWVVPLNGSGVAVPVYPLQHLRLVADFPDNIDDHPPVPDLETVAGTRAADVILGMQWSPDGSMLLYAVQLPLPFRQDFLGNSIRWSVWHARTIERLGSPGASPQGAVDFSAQELLVGRRLRPPEGAGKLPLVFSDQYNQSCSWWDASSQYVYIWGSLGRLMGGQCAFRQRVVPQRAAVEERGPHQIREGLDVWDKRGEWPGPVGQVTVYNLPEPDPVIIGDGGHDGFALPPHARKYSRCFQP